MVAHVTRKLLPAAVALVCSACAAENPYPATQVTQITPAEATRLLGCQDDEVAMCIETNCELEDYYCANRGDVREMFKAGEFRH
jgi:hypothetical protein